MSDLVEFLRARLDEDEAAARDAVGRAVWCDNTGEWKKAEVRDEFGTIPFVMAVGKDGARTQVANLQAAHSKLGRQEHIARHDPARVLREVEAKRRIVEAEDTRLRELWRERREEHRLTFDDWMRPMNLVTLRALAAIYSDHPDYRDEWNP